MAEACVRVCVHHRRGLSPSFSLSLSLSLSPAGFRNLGANPPAASATRRVMMGEPNSPWGNYNLVLFCRVHSDWMIANLLFKLTVLRFS